MKEALVHIRLDYENARNGKKDVLMTELHVLNALKSLNNYHALRSDELKLRAKFNQKVTDMLASLKKMKETLPSSQLPASLHKNKEDIRRDIQGRKDYNNSVENELGKIKERLSNLQE